MKGVKRIIVLTVIASTAAISFSACHRRGASSDDETPDTSTYRPLPTPATQFERDLKYIRDGHFTYVWIFSRKDGKELTPDDSQALRTNAPIWPDSMNFIAASRSAFDPIIDPRIVRCR